MPATKTKKVSKKQPINKAHKAKPVNRSTISRRTRLMKLVQRHRLVTVLLSILLFIAFSSLYQSYKVWDNARLIQGMFRDFPQIAAEVENATGIDLDYTVECSVTTEKFGRGVNTCEFSSTTQDHQDKIDIAKESLVVGSKLEYVSDYEHNEGIVLSYAGVNSCSFSYYDGFVFSCIIPVKNENITLARQLYENQKE